MGKESVRNWRGGFLHMRRRAADEERQMTYVAVIGGFAPRWPCCFEKI